jgi:ribosomal 30S subunit maturation factor RimM
MKKIVLVVLLLGIAGVAGVVRSYTKSAGNHWPVVINGDKQSAGNAREEIRKSFELAAGARVEVSGINGWVKIETSERKTADVYIERTGESQEVLNRRKITIESTAAGLTIRGEKGDAGLLSRMFGSSPTEHVTLRLPKQISLVTNGVNGSVTSGGIDGTLEVHGVNGKVDIAQASDSAEISGINGNVSVGLAKIGKDGVEISGINGNIDLQLSEGVNADLETHGMNGQVTSELPNVVVDKSSHGSYSARIGSGGNSISASGINGNIRLTRMMNATSGA